MAYLIKYWILQTIPVSNSFWNVFWTQITASKFSEHSKSPCILIERKSASKNVSIKLISCSYFLIVIIYKYIMYKRHKFSFVSAILRIYVTLNRPCNNSYSFIPHRWNINIADSWDVCINLRQSLNGSFIFSCPTF